MTSTPMPHTTALEIESLDRLHSALSRARALGLPVRFALLVDGDVVVVTPAGRLDPDGFLLHADLGRPLRRSDLPTLPRPPLAQSGTPIPMGTCLAVQAFDRVPCSDTLAQTLLVATVVCVFGATLLPPHPTPEALFLPAFPLVLLAVLLRVTHVAPIGLLLYLRGLRLFTRSA